MGLDTGSDTGEVGAEGGQQTDFAGEMQGEEQRTDSAYNLDKDPRFNEWKSKMDKQVAESNRMAQQAEIRRRQSEQLFQQQMQQMQQQMEQAVMSNMDETGQLEFRYKTEAQKRQMLEQQMQQMQAEQERKSFIDELSKRYNIPAENVNVEHPMMAMTSTADHLYKRLSELEAENAKLKKANEARMAARTKRQTWVAVRPAIPCRIFSGPTTMPCSPVMASWPTG